MPQRVRRASTFDVVVGHLGRRAWPLGMSAALLIFGMAYIFGWGSVVEHVPDLWVCPRDLWTTYLNASLFAHGHVGAVYQANYKFVELPGILIALFPLAVLSGSFHTAPFEILNGRSVPAPWFSVSVKGVNIPFLNPQEITLHSNHYVIQPGWTQAVVPYAIVLSCSALFGFDALAERLGVPGHRRALLCVAETVLLFNVMVLWGHPEDAIALAFLSYSLVFALDQRVVGAAWLAGVAVAFQPLALLAVPVLLALAGRQQLVAFLIRTAVPSVVLVAVPLAASFRATIHALADQPSPPAVNHVTPWTSLAPHLGGGLVAAGPIRLLGFALAAGLGVWVYRRWRLRPELVVWACALALALRSYTESVMTPYYAWAALALGLVIAARARPGLFELCLALAVAITVVAQWSLGWFEWWALQVGGVTALLAIACRPTAVVPVKRPAAAGPRRPVKATAGGRRPQPTGGRRQRQQPSGRPQPAKSPPPRLATKRPGR